MLRSKLDYFIDKKRKDNAACVCGRGGVGVLGWSMPFLNPAKKQANRNSSFSLSCVFSHVVTQLPHVPYRMGAYHDKK
jgi:hypothetical protein